MTEEKIKSVMHKLDLMNKPYIIFLHPNDAEMLKKTLPDIEKNIVIQSNLYIEKGKGYWMERKDLEPWM